MSYITLRVRVLCTVTGRPDDEVSPEGGGGFSDNEPTLSVRQHSVRFVVGIHDLTPDRGLTRFTLH